MDLTDYQVVQLYRVWSEDAYCAGFMSPSEGTVKSFREWLKGPKAREDDPERNLVDYEEEMGYRIYQSSGWRIGSGNRKAFCFKDLF